MSDHHVRWKSFQWWTSLCWSYLLYDSRSTFRSLCSEAISVHMLGSSSLTWVFRVCNCFAPVVFERRAYHTRLTRGVSARRTFATVHTQGEHLYFDNLVRDHLIMLPSITCNQYKWYDMAIIILCLWSPSPKHRACDLHLRSTVMITIVTGSTPWSPS